jgi:hypothetical protein
MRLLQLKGLFLQVHVLEEIPVASNVMSTKAGQFSPQATRTKNIDNSSMSSSIATSFAEMNEVYRGTFNKD